MRNRRIHFSCLAVGAAALVGLACGGGGGGGGKSAALSEYVAAVKSSDGTITAQLKTGSPPAAATAVHATSNLAAAAATLTFLRGGTAAVPVDPTATRIIIAITGVDGYWELTGLTPGAGQTVLVTFGQNSPETFTLRLGAGDASTIASYDDIAVALTTVGTGDVQVNVTWDLDVDVDLHVLDPSGEEIYYGNDMSTSGGTLDLDSNAGCNLDHVKAENITWPVGGAPAGTYKVLVDYFEACTTGPVNYVVTVNVKGHAPQTFAKTFADGASDFGSTCFPSSGDTLLCGVQITTFTVP